MRAGVLIRSGLSALGGFLAVTMAFCVALVVAITGPPSWAELRGVGDNIGAALSQIGAFASRQIEAHNDARERPEPAPEREFAAPAPPAPPRVMAEAPPVEDSAPTTTGAEDLVGGLDEPSPPITRAPRPPPRLALPQATPRAAPQMRAPERAPSTVRPPPPRTLAARPPEPPPTQTVEIAPPIEPAVEQNRGSLIEQLMQAVEALIPTMEVSEEAPKPAPKDTEPLLPDSYADGPDAEPLPPPPAPPAHAEARRRARGWAPAPGDRFPADERDLERWGQN